MNSARVNLNHALMIMEICLYETSSQTLTLNLGTYGWNKALPESNVYSQTWDLWVKQSSSKIRDGIHVSLLNIWYGCGLLSLCHGRSFPRKDRVDDGLLELNCLSTTLSSINNWYKLKISHSYKTTFVSTYMTFYLNKRLRLISYMVNHYTNNCIVKSCC